jgi:hypothetical protein
VSGGCVDAAVDVLTKDLQRFGYADGSGSGGSGGGGVRDQQQQQRFQKQCY